MTVLDYSSRPPVHFPPDVEGVVRYIAPRHADGSRRSKCITEAELAAHHAAGRSVGFVFEDDAGNSLKGAAQGDRDGSIAVAELQLLGAPRGVAIYAAVDRDITPAQLPVVAAYLDAFHRHSTAAGFRRGDYGEYDVVVTMLRDGHVDLGWQTVAWSHHAIARGVRGVVLYQHGQIVVDGTSCDVNDVWAPDWGQWRAVPQPAPQPAPAPAHPIVTSYPEEHMHSIDIAIDTDKDGDGYFDLPKVAPHDVVSIVSNAVNPPTAGYKLVPDLGRLDVNGGTRVVAEHAEPNARIDVTLWVVG